MDEHRTNSSGCLTQRFPSYPCVESYSVKSNFKHCINNSNCPKHFIIKNFNRLWALGAVVALLNDTDSTPIEKTKQLLPSF